MNLIREHHRSILQRIAHRVMKEKGLKPDFTVEVHKEMDLINGPSKEKNNSIRDLRNLLWCSIDNDDSRDLDQLTVAEKLKDSSVKIFVAIADVDALVKKSSAIDDYAQFNTTSVYTAAEIFPMLPEKLSTDYTSLNFDEDRLAVVVEIIVDTEGNILKSDIYRALVHNKAQLAYKGVARWLDGGEAPESLERVNGLGENIRLQNNVAQKLKSLRTINGALGLETIEAKFEFSDDEISKLEPDERNEAKDIIQDFMIASNGVTARYLESKNFPSIRRVVKTPKRWERIVAIAAEHHYKLPAQPDSKALDKFLETSKKNNPVNFPDLSLTVIKLLGSGEYNVDLPGEDASGHFGLAVKDYAHSTAPNRRFPDLITQRLLKAAMSGSPSPYSIEELNELAAHCTSQEDNAKKVERLLEKSAAALFLSNKTGQIFDAIVTGASEKGTWVRIFNPPVEGRVIRGFEGMDVGERVRVKLVDTNAERGFIDFTRA